MQICRTSQELRRMVAGFRRPLGLVPTMGALHAGHLALVAASTAANQATVVSIFVNPSQFAPQEDLSRYPRPFEADLALLKTNGVDIVFAPAAAEMYPPGFATWVNVEGPPAERLEAERRPGHFRGVATIVAKLFSLVCPDAAYFGQKDAQQLAVIRRMVGDLNLPVLIVAVPTVRECDGLALSSRNVYLSAEERRAALVLSRALSTAQAQFAAGTRDPDVVRQAMRALFAAEPHATLDYVDLVDPASFQPDETLADETLAVVACRIGATRLIDNAKLGRN
ncbi:MAG TPA: pantoate--beta-alanine ligase [Chloroflexota bacterium]|jgi:pantoate--beta-alanine ligase|nr:pantoate--beta-alanine ligase [Chloroflexota bacterium]